MTDGQILQSLISHDETVTRQFLFKDCRPLFKSIINKVFSYHVDYDEFVNEFYLYLMDDDARRLRQFQGRSSIFQWLKVVAIRYFIAKRDYMIDMAGTKPLSPKEPQITDQSSARMDMETLLDLMPNKRYVHIIRSLILEDRDPASVAEELSVTIDNLYNLKKRAVAAMTRMALNEAAYDEKGNRK